MSYRYRNRRTGHRRDDRDRRRQRQPQKSRRQKKYEESAIVLDVIPAEINKRNDRYKDDPIIQAIGVNWFTLLEIVPNDDNTVNLMDTIELSKDNRDNIKTIIGRIKYDQLTHVAELQMMEAITKTIKESEERFVKWLNTTGPINIRLHTLQLIKGIGPKGLKEILDQRKINPFESYEDFCQRTSVGDIRELIKQRVVDEIMNEEEKHRLFTRQMGNPDRNR